MVDGRNRESSIYRVPEHHCVKKKVQTQYPLGTGQRLSVNQVISLELEGVVGIVCHRS